MKLSVGVCIPFRDRGIDPLRTANLARAASQWSDFDITVVTNDGRNGDEQFNRSAAYNAGVKLLTGVDVYVFAESDMLVDIGQVYTAAAMSVSGPGLVVPFTEYRYLTPRDSIAVRDKGADYTKCRPAWSMGDGRSIGAINVMSAMTMNLVGQWDETFEGNWYDDDAMARAFEVTCGPTRFVKGPAYHLHHLPGHRGDHLTDEDKAATRRNQDRLALYRWATTPDRVRELTRGGR